MKYRIFLIVILFIGGLLMLEGCIDNENQKSEKFNGNIKEIINTKEGYVFIERNISYPITYNEILDLQEKMKKFAEYYNISIMLLETPEIKDEKIIACGYRIYPEGRVKIYLGKIRDTKNAKMVYENAEAWYITNIRNALMSNNSKIAHPELKNRQDKKIVGPGKGLKIMEGELDEDISTEEGLINIREGMKIFFTGITCGYQYRFNNSNMHSWMLHYGKCEDEKGVNLPTFKIENYILLKDTGKKKIKKLITITHKYNNISIFGIWERYPMGSYRNSFYERYDYSKSKIPEWVISFYNYTIHIETESVPALDISLSEDIGKIITKFEYEKCILGICSESPYDEITWHIILPKSFNFSNFTQTETQPSNLSVKTDFYNRFNSSNYILLMKPI